MRQKLEHGMSYLVLILVVVEDVLVLVIVYANVNGTQVLILVVVEDVLVQRKCQRY